MNGEYVNLDFGGEQFRIWVYTTGKETQDDLRRMALSVVFRYAGAQLGITRVSIEELIAKEVSA